MNLVQARGERVAHWLRGSWARVKMRCFQWEIHFSLGAAEARPTGFSGFSRPLFFTIVSFCAGYFIVILAVGLVIYIYS